MRRGLKNTVSHRAEIQGNDQLDDDKKEEGLCPCMSDVIELIIKKKEEEGDLDKKCQQDECPHIPGKNTLFGIPGRPLHDVRIRGCNS